MRWRARTGPVEQGTPYAVTVSLVRLCSRDLGSRQTLPYPVAARWVLSQGPQFCRPAGGEHGREFVRTSLGVGA
jgi:hypothetical protein